MWYAIRRGIGLAALRTGLFVIIYATTAGTLFILITLLGINLTLATSFLSAPVWVACIWFSIAVQRHLTRNLK